MVGPVAFPLAKLAVITIRQAGRPLARMVENLANRSSAFRKMVCLPLAQFYHHYEVKIRLAALNLGVGKVTKVTKLSEEKAVTQASEIISEATILGTVVVLLILEYRNRHAESEKAEAESKMESDEIRERIFELETKLEENAEQIRKLVRGMVRHSDKEGRQLPEELTNSLDEKPLQVKRIVMVQDDLEHNKGAVSKTGKTIDGRTDGEKKTMSEELEEFWEEVVEEILDSVNPEDD